MYVYRGRYGSGVEVSVIRLFYCYLRNSMHGYCFKNETLIPIVKL